MLKSKKWLSWILPGLVFIIGIGLSLALQIHSRDGVFFSSDAGLKALLAQQFSTGNWQASLEISQPDWVQTLWRQGLYPFAPPYVYEQQGNYFITFPFTFPAITAPFYALMGHHGLYVVPLISLWVTWLRLWHVCSVWRIHSGITAIGMAVVIVASPLTLYGAMYWEHTLAVALAFWGLSGMLLHALPKGQTNRISVNQALVNGVCVGLAVWFRPEFLCLVLILGTLTGTSRLSQLPVWCRAVLPRRLTLSLVIAFTGAMVLTVLGLLGINTVAYGSPMGVYVEQGAESLGQRLGQIGGNYGHMVMSLLRYFPASLLGLGLPWLLRGRARSTGLILLAIGGVFAIAAPVISPPATHDLQWGPRQYLILVPITGLLVAAGLQHLWPVGQNRWGLLGAIAFVMALGIHTNLVNGGLQPYRDRLTNSTSLPSTYEPVAPAIVALANYEERWVAMSQQQVAHQLWPSVQLKTFFRTETDEALKQLATELVNQGESSFLYICASDTPCPVADQGMLTLRQIKGNNNDEVPMRVSFKSLGTFGKYPFYRGLIQINKSSK
ncbi:MAG: LA_3751/LA_3752 family putative glycosyltransferase [Leptolyngbyaceae cyanobacterium]